MMEYIQKEGISEGFRQNNFYFNGPPKKIDSRIGILYNFLFPLIWTLFFAILGIIIQSIESKTFIFKEFFVNNYIDWFKSFGSFTNQTYYISETDLILSILKRWYYFFYTGGLISLIWEFFAWIFSFKSTRREQKIIYKSPVIYQSAIQSELRQPEEEIPKTEFEDIDILLKKGYKFLDEKNLSEARLIYNEIKWKYSSEKDPTGRLYQRILDFYKEIVESKR